MNFKKNTLFRFQIDTIMGNAFKQTFNSLLEFIFRSINYYDIVQICGFALCSINHIVHHVLKDIYFVNRFAEILLRDLYSSF